MEKVERKFSILVIEDNPGDFALVEEFLLEQIESLTLLHAKNFGEASVFLKDQSKQFDVILLDLSLPDKTGVPLIKAIVDQCPNTPVIVLTGYTDMVFGANSLSLGISDYILKEELTAISLFKSVLYSSERKKIVQALQESEKKYSELFHLSPQPMWVFDPKTLCFLNVNDAAIKQYGYSHDEFLAMTILDMSPLADRAKIKIGFDNFGRNGRLMYRGDLIHVKKDKKLIRVDIQSNIIEYKGERAVVALVADVTERLNYISAIEKQNKILTEISWIQSHIVRAPLARIMGLIQVFKGSAELDEKTQVLDYLLISANELDGAIKDITDKSRITEYDRISENC